MTEQHHYSITVRRIGTRDMVYREGYTGTPQQAERRASDVWSRPEYCSGAAVDRFRLYLHREGEKRAALTIG